MQLTRNLMFSVDFVFMNKTSDLHCTSQFYKWLHIKMLSYSFQVCNWRFVQNYRAIMDKTKIIYIYIWYNPSHKDIILLGAHPRGLGGGSPNFRENKFQVRENKWKDKAKHFELFCSLQIIDSYFLYFLNKTRDLHENYTNN